MAQTVVGLYTTHTAAVDAVHALREEGFAPERISILAPDVREVEGFGDEVGVRVLQAAGGGAAAGGLLGGLSAFLFGATGLLVPGVGALFAAGPLAAAVVGAITGSTVGGFIGILAGLGLPHHAAEEYSRELSEGRTLVFVDAGADYALAELALNRAQPLNLHHFQESLPQA